MQSATMTSHLKPIRSAPLSQPADRPGSSLAGAPEPGGGRTGGPAPRPGRGPAVGGPFSSGSCPCPAPAAGFSHPGTRPLPGAGSHRAR